MVRRTSSAAAAALAIFAGFVTAALIQGGPTDQRVTGTSKVDRILAGRGDDVIFARDKRRDFVNCGPGYDRAVLDRIDRALGCEVRLYPPTPALVVAMPLPLAPVKAGPPASTTPLRRPSPMKSQGPKPTTGNTQTIPTPPTPVGARFGLVANADHRRVIDVAARLGARLVRQEFPIGTPVAQVAADVNYASARGMDTITQVGILPGIPSDDAARSACAWPGKYLEWGNETSYTYQGTQDRGRDYGRSAQVVAGCAGGRLIAQADDGNTGSGWVADTIAGGPRLPELVAGWSIHPYGPRQRWFTRLERTINQLGVAGARDPRLFVTEWGIATDDGRALSDNYGFPVNLSYAAAGAAVSENVMQMLAAFPQIAALTYYQVTDQQPSGSGQREHYFGVTKQDGADKPGLTEKIRALIARYP